MTYAPATKRSTMTKARVARIFIACGGKCHVCGQAIRDGEKYDIEHPDPLWAGGSDNDAKLRLVHVRCHKGKTADEAKQRARRNATIARGYVGAAPSRKPFPGSKRDRFRKRIDGTVVPRT